MLMKVAFPSTIELDGFIGQLQHFGKTQTQIVFSTPVEPRGLNGSIRRKRRIDKNLAAGDVI